MTLKTLLRSAALVALLPLTPMAEGSDMRLFEDFTDAPEDRWTFVADGVMGGVSEGQAQVVRTPEGPAIRLRGEVSLENNGGFIQVRHRFEGGLPADTSGMTLTVRGNGEGYFVFLRTKGLARRWHSYRHAFETSGSWQEVRLPFADFYPSHDGMAEGFRPQDVTGIGIVAYGRAFEADVTVRAIALY